MTLAWGQPPTSSLRRTWLPLLSRTTSRNGRSKPGAEFGKKKGVVKLAERAPYIYSGASAGGRGAEHAKDLGQEGTWQEAANVLAQAGIGSVRARVLEGALPYGTPLFQKAIRGAAEGAGVMAGGGSAPQRAGEATILSPGEQATL